MSILHIVGDWLYWFFGLAGSGPMYAFWSGPGSDIGELAIVGTLLGLLRSRNCEIHGCWRLGRHLSAANHRLCRKHHPDEHLTIEAAHAAHHAALQLGVSNPGGRRRSSTTGRFE